MATLDAGVLLAEISPDSPCGDDVEYDPTFLELEQVVHGKPEVQYGDTVVAATPPDWKAAQALALELFNKSRDLRVAAHLARALLNRQGFTGLAEGMALIEGLLERHWDHVYPQLDPDDDNDPTARINALAVLVEQSGMLLDVRDTALAASRTHGIVRLRDIEYATGETPVPDGVEPPSLASIDAAIADVRDEAATTHAALLSARQSNTRIETLLTERVGAAQAIDLSPLSRLLQQAAGFLGERVSDANEQTAGEAPAGEGGDDAPAAPGGATRAAPSGEVNSRQDVIRLLDKICAYYEQHEPSSPVPLLLTRARRLVDKSFIEILQDLAPEGLGQARQVGGIEE
ncbi:MULTISPECIES: type VI secretion system protein TssA [Paraburkholderia]|uniref:Type VI secretion system protein ImpA n=2 Tax=Paraburkholderia TaxID=1822464 RepID=A0A7Z7B5S7_9BURK|nr:MULTISPECIES: type VI secretion system protein TssA [Paraburkholderia]AUT64833.1 type VI secretion system protein TssA [Paraburkholderia terrae]SDH14089.1 type VI secretion system protein ImpA [Paraburkholderia steynii]